MDWYIAGSVISIAVSCVALGAALWVCADLRSVAELLRDMRRFGRTEKG